MKLLFSLLLTFFCSQLVIGQTLQLPPRSVAALNGADVVTAITPLSLENRELYIFNEIMNGNVPAFSRNMSLVTDSSFIGSAFKVVEYYVIPDYLAIGHDTNYYLCPMTPILGQRLADSTDCMLPTRKMVDQIWANAGLHMNPESIPPSPLMTTVPVMSNHNDMVWIQRQPLLGSSPLGTLVAGNKKDVVISNQIYSLPSPARVLIYGWHYTSGSPIQPLYGGHIDTYADYSHGIRLVQKAMTVDGVPADGPTILGSSTDYMLLSDEGIIPIAYYPDTSSTLTAPPTIPTSYSVFSGTSTSINIQVFNHVADQYQLYLSTDGASFSGPFTYSSPNFSIAGLSTEDIHYVKLTASNSFGTSGYSEVLAAVPSVLIDSALVVNGFDRGSTGNTYDFIIEHGSAISQAGMTFSSATNDAVESGMVNLGDFPIVDYILGEESTVDETFSAVEQTMIQQYLENGGNLFISGAEIGWDLDQQGSSADQLFYNQILKADYVDDAPGGLSSTYYQIDPAAGSIFNGMATVNFDDGTNGSYDVDYPDVLDTLGGSTPCMIYTGLTNEIGGIQYEGLIGAGIVNAKLVHLGIPIETVYPDATREEMMMRIINFFRGTTSTTVKVNDDLGLTIYPNPISSSATIRFSANEMIESIVITNLLGEIVKVIPANSQQGRVIVDFSEHTSGVYFCQLIANGHILSREKMILQK